ncbi:hypothetical protein SEA_APHELION_158 [Gordonia phage Aphelion]|uniref:Uncharacterized protein n=1 Tax=Gordonia phage Aphelion TaxID=2507860 RepID=A0A410TDD1_9CAUD|nr:hypothetical protein SEA_APHELION_158 [Gordonia phage Aphelion]
MLNKDEKDTTGRAIESVEYAIEKAERYLEGPIQRSVLNHLRSARADLEVLRDGNLVRRGA